MSPRAASGKMPGMPPSLPDTPRSFEEAVRALARAEAPYKERLEQLLVDLAPGESDALMMLMKEGRGAFGILLESGAGASVLFAGDARSGTPIALASLGLRVTVADRCATRLRLARVRAEALCPGRISLVHARVHAGARLPFADASFDVCVQEPGGETRPPLEPREALRVARKEVFDVRGNRLGYKRSLGRRGAFDRGLAGFLRTALRAPAGERTRRAAEAAVREGGAARVESFALYPHALEFSHVVALGGDGPRLSIGPRERRNRLKVLAARAGLFGALAPSFGVHGARAPRGETRLARVIGELAERLGVPAPGIDALVATRSNNALVLTRGEGAGWALHLPLQPSKRRLVRVHHDWLGAVRRRHPDVPVPEPLFLGEIDGVFLSAERRVRGLGGTEVTGDERATAAMLTSVSEIAARLLDEAPTEVTDAVAGELLDERLERVLRLVPSEATRRSLRERADRFRAHVTGRALRLGTYHADLRGKHVVVDGEGGAARAVLDWGASEDRFFPLADLLQLVVHQRKQERGGPFGAAWRSMSDRASWRAGERDALLGYVERAGLEDRDIDAFLDAFPLFVAGMAERNWDFSRPDWVARQFGL